MEHRRREFVVGAGALMTTALFHQACGRGSSRPRSVDAASKADPPIVNVLRYGVTAPSAHNTQPWLIELVSDTEARLFMDTKRLLPATDPPARQVHISHGTLVEVSAIAATHLGYRAEIEILPDGAMGPGEFGTKPTARIQLIKRDAAVEDPLALQLLTRRTSRLPYDGPIVTEEEWASIVEQAGGERIAIAPLAEPKLLEAFEIIKSAMAVEENDEALYDETREWFRFSKRAIREHGDGLSINTAGLPGFSAGTANMFLSARNFHKEKN
ncbi:MAG: hypothetical protein WBG86_05670, partial [Polyangiales bacterium]